MDKIIGIIIVFGTITGCLFLGGNISSFLDIPSLLFVLGIVIGSLIFKFGIHGLLTSWRSREFCELGQTSALMAGILGPVIGAIHILNNISDPKRLGPAMAVSMITFLYAIIINLCFALVKKDDCCQDNSQSKRATLMSFVGFFLCMMTIPTLMMVLK